MTNIWQKMNDELSNHRWNNPMTEYVANYHEKCCLFKWYKHEPSLHWCHKGFTLITRNIITSIMKILVNIKWIQKITKNCDKLIMSYLTQFDIIKIAL